MTASLMISCTRDSGSLFTSFEYMRHAKSQCRPSSRLMSSFEKLRPGIRPRFLSQKIEQNEPEKKMPSTAANAKMRSAYAAERLSHHFNAQCAFLVTHGIVSIARNKWFFSCVSLISVSIKSEYTSEWMFSIAIWKP
uniref:Uncharacterized protein n=1 Tax=Globisporangium ultimum (strain ATCC 200006 / CBS 805.95 / DAOM BR144) TaxID=431595 RepID=K3W711_GLOUD